MKVFRSQGPSLVPADVDVADTHEILSTRFSKQKCFIRLNPNFLQSILSSYDILSDCHVIGQMKKIIIY
jgi:hypothetical protein